MSFGCIVVFEVEAVGIVAGLFAVGEIICVGVGCRWPLFLGGLLA